MTFLEIRGELIKHNSNMLALSKEIGITYMGVKQVVVRNSKSRRVAQAVADKINQPLEVVFPEYKDLKPKRDQS